MKRTLFLVAAAALGIFAAFGLKCAGDEVSPRLLDLEFTSALESWVAQACYGSVPDQLRRLVDGLDSDSYLERRAAGNRLLARCLASPSEVRLLMRARATERRPEVRYWLNRLLRQLHRCQRCEGLGYCAQYRPANGAAANDWAPCQRCGRFEWNHGWIWEQDTYVRSSCPECHGLGTYWLHYAVD
jgi:hypothetical protein